MARKWHQHVTHFVVPHSGNNFRPKVVGATAIVTVLVLAVLFEGLYLVSTKVSLDRGSLLASILPAALISLTNADRADAGVGEVTENSVLAMAAQKKAEDMAAKGYFSHVSPDGTQPWQWIADAGYEYSYAGENLAVNFEDSKDVEEAWMNSPTHRANIVKSQYTEVGIATARGEYKGKEATFVVQFFATPKAVAVAPVAPVEEAPAPVAVETNEVQVLGETVAVTPVGESVAAPTIKDTVVQAATSPNATVTTILTILAGLVALMFLIALIAHVRVPYLEALGGSFAVLVVVICFLAFNTAQIPELEISEQAASAILAL